MVSMITSLLVPLLALLSMLSSSLAAPLGQEPLHKLTLRKIPTIRDDEHPGMAFQRHHNHAIRKLHHCTNTTPPTKDFFSERTLRRRLLIEDCEQLEKRLWCPITSPSTKAAKEKRLWYQPDSSDPTNDKSPVGPLAKLEKIFTDLNAAKAIGAAADAGPVGRSLGAGPLAKFGDLGGGPLAELKPAGPLAKLKINFGILTAAEAAEAGTRTSSPAAEPFGASRDQAAPVVIARNLGSLPVDDIEKIVQVLQNGAVQEGAGVQKEKSGSGEMIGKGASSASATPSVAVGLSSDSGVVNGKAIEVTASGSNANGFSNAALKALAENTVTESTSTLIKGGLDYQIEADDVGYLAEVQIGTPAQSFLMLMDTGSGDTWVPSSACTAAQCGNHLTLGTVKSSTFVATKVPFSVTYGSGSVAGSQCKDAMSIAGMALPNHAFGVTTQESAQFSGPKISFDGLMGLSFNALSQQGVATPIDSLASSGQIKQAVLGIALGRVADGENDGELVFGQADASKLDAATTQTLAVTSTAGFWQVAMSAVTVNGKSTSVGRQAILDTGTSLIVAPAADALAFHAQIEGAATDGQGGFTIPCTTDAVVSMTFGNAAFQIDARDLTFQPTSNSVTGQCLSSVSAGTVTDDQTWLLGDAFLKNVYMTTNVQARTVQLSARTDLPGSSSAAKTSVVVAESNNQVAKVSAGHHGKNHSSRASILGLGGIAAYLSRRVD